jgi:hypothetical protein
MAGDGGGGRLLEEASPVGPDASWNVVRGPLPGLGPAAVPGPLRGPPNWGNCAQNQAGVMPAECCFPIPIEHRP